MFDIKDIILDNDIDYINYNLQNIDKIDLIFLDKNSYNLKHGSVNPVNNIENKLNKIDLLFSNKCGKEHTHIKIVFSDDMSRITGDNHITGRFSPVKTKFEDANAIYIMLESNSTVFDILNTFVHEETHAYQYFSKDRIFEADFVLNDKIKYIASPCEIMAFAVETKFCQYLLDKMSDDEKFKQKYADTLKEFIHDKFCLKCSKFSFKINSLFNKFLIFHRIGKTNINSTGLVKNIHSYISTIFDKTIRKEYKNIENQFFDMNKEIEHQLNCIENINTNNKSWNLLNINDYEISLQEDEKLNHDIADELLSDKPCTSPTLIVTCDKNKDDKEIEL